MTVVELTLQARTASGEAFELAIVLGAPVCILTDDYSCPLQIVGLDQYRTVRDIPGASAFQALSLAIDYARNALDAFVAEGGELRSAGEVFDVNVLRLKGG
jgi:hypothetical protein